MGLMNPYSILDTDGSIASQYLGLAIPQVLEIHPSKPVGNKQDFTAVVLKGLLDKERDRRVTCVNIRNT